MFCHEFEKMAGDLAAGRLMEAGKRERALRHASECPACALRLNSERKLEAGLRAFREDAEDMEAPPHLKTALRAAFDRRLGAAPAAPALISARARNSALRWVAAAALILIAIGGALLLGSASPNTNLDTAGGAQSAQLEQSRQPVIDRGDQRPKVEPRVARKTPAERRARRLAANYDDMALSNETVSDYIPLTYLADATALESGTVLRVELPSSALVAMGLPMNVERTDSRVKADLIVGDDGVARAVRFVEQDNVRR